MEIIASVLSSVSHGGFGSGVHHGDSRFVLEFFLVYLLLGRAFQICFVSLSMLFGEIHVQKYFMSVQIFQPGRG